MSRIGLLVTTDGRYHYAMKTIRSLARHVWPITARVIFDDSGDPKYQEWLRVRFPNFELYPARRRMGIVRAHWRAFRHMARRTDIDWVFLCQDDFTFERHVNLEELVAVMDAQPHLAQLVLRRQLWYADEIAAGGIFEHHGVDRFVERTDGLHTWTEHTAFWSLNPMLVRRSLLVDVPYSLGAKGEHSYGRRVLETMPGARFAYWGGMADPPAIRHIGDVQAGGYGY